MSYELDFYGTRINVFVRDGHASLLRRSVADLFDVDNTDEMMDPFLPYIHNEMITLASLQWQIPTMVQHVLGNTVASAMKEREERMNILSEELVESIIKQLTYAKRALPLISMPQDLSPSGIINRQMPWSQEDSYFTPRAISQLLQSSHRVRIPEDIPFHYLIVRDGVWDTDSSKTVPRNTLQKVISMRYLGYVLQCNAEKPAVLTPTTRRMFRSSTLDE